MIFGAFCENRKTRPIKKLVKDIIIINIGLVSMCLFLTIKERVDVFNLILPLEYGFFIGSLIAYFNWKKKYPIKGDNKSLTPTEQK